MITYVWERWNQLSINWPLLIEYSWKQYQLCKRCSQTLSSENIFYYCKTLTDMVHWTVSLFCEHLVHTLLIRQRTEQQDMYMHCLHRSLCSIADMWEALSSACVYSQAWLWGYHYDKSKHSCTVLENRIYYPPAL